MADRNGLRNLVLAIWIVVLASAALFAVAYAAPHDPPDHPTPPPTHTPQPSNTPRPTQEEAGFQPVTLCHASPTGEGGSGPAKSYELITVDNQGQLNGHLGHPNDIIPAPEGGCPVPTEEPTDGPISTSTDVGPGPTATPEAESTLQGTPTPGEPTATQESTQEATPTLGEPTATPRYTDEPRATPTLLATPKTCWLKEIGALFELIGPNGQIGTLASYQINPNTGRWSLPNVGAQERCLGFVAVNVGHVWKITADCRGHINIYTHSCTGGGCAAVYGKD